MAESDDAFALLQPLVAFYHEQRQCGHLDSAVGDWPGGRIVLTCSRGAATVRPADTE
jgi:hypothetical protein